ncbi:MAG: MATE family efflux transporter [Rhodospirillales bacterium]|nr:MATE family efflux transporter [Rhodospirillales bacterium]
MMHEPPLRDAALQPAVDGTPWRQEARAMAALAWPLSLTFFAETAIAAIDLAFIGRLGAESLAGASLGVTAHIVFYLLAVGIVVATAPLAAQAMGARQPRQVRRVVRQGLWIAALLGVPSAFILMGTEPVLLALGQPTDASRLAQDYLDFFGWTLPWGIGLVVLRNFAAVLGRPRLGLWIFAAGIPLNALLDYGLIFGRLGMPRLELAGAGLASVVAQAAMFAAMLAVVLTTKPLARYRILGNFWRPDWVVFARIFRLGLPIAGIMAMEFGLIVVSQVMIGWIGSTSLAAHQIALTLASLTFKVPLGIAQAATVRVGRAAGRRDADGVGRAGWTALAMGVAFMTLASLVMWTWPEAMAAVFLDLSLPGNDEVARLAALLVLVAAVFQVADGAQTIGAGVLRGLNDTAVPLVFGVVGYVAIGIPAAWLLGFPGGLGAVGVWMGMAIGLIAVAFCHVIRFAFLVRRRHLPRVMSA